MSNEEKAKSDFDKIRELANQMNLENWEEKKNAIIKVVDESEGYWNLVKNTKPIVRNPPMKTRPPYRDQR
jgi:hypothetical protein